MHQLVLEATHVNGLAPKNHTQRNHHIHIVDHNNNQATITSNQHLGHCISNTGPYTYKGIGYKVSIYCEVGNQQV